MQRANPNDEDAPKKWYVTQVTAAQVDETQVAMDLADETTLNPSEAMMPIRQAPQNPHPPSARRREREAGQLEQFQRHPLQHRRRN